MKLPQKYLYQKHLTQPGAPKIRKGFSNRSGAMGLFQAMQKVEAMAAYS